MHYVEKYTKWRLNFSVLSDFSYLLPLISRSFPSPCPEFLLLLRGIDVQTMFTSLIAKSSPKYPLRSKLLSAKRSCVPYTNKSNCTSAAGRSSFFLSQNPKSICSPKEELGLYVLIRIDYTILWYFFISSIKKKINLMILFKKLTGRNCSSHVTSHDPVKSSII